MVKHTQPIRWLLPKNCLSVFNHFVGLALKGLTKQIFGYQSRGQDPTKHLQWSFLAKIVNSYSHEVIKVT